MYVAISISMRICRSCKSCRMLGKSCTNTNQGKEAQTVLANPRRPLLRTHKAAHSDCSCVMFGSVSGLHYPSLWFYLSLCYCQGRSFSCRRAAAAEWSCACLLLGCSGKREGAKSKTSVCDRPRLRLFNSDAHLHVCFFLSVCVCVCLITQQFSYIPNNRNRRRFIVWRSTIPTHLLGDCEESREVILNITVELRAQVMRCVLKHTCAADFSRVLTNSACLKTGW